MAESVDIRENLWAVKTLTGEWEVKGQFHGRNCHTSFVGLIYKDEKGWGFCPTSGKIPVRFKTFNAVIEWLREG